VLAITATPIGGGQSFVISDGTGSRGPGGKLFVNDFHGTYDASVNTVMYLDAPGQTNIRNASYNQSANIPCEVEYEFSSEGACFAFVADLQSKCPVLANVVITAGGTSRTLPQVNLRPLKWQMIGQVSCRVTYPFTFGLVS